MILGLGNALSSIALRTGAVSTASEVTLATDNWSVVLDGTNDHIIIPDSNALSFTDGAGNDDPFSISAWVKLADLTTARVVSKEDGTDANREYLFGTDGADRFNLILGTSTDNLNVTATTSTELTVDTWHHIIATYDGSNAASGIKLYVDGSAISTTDVSIGTYAGMPNSTGNLKVGRFDVNGSVMDGRAAQVDIWSSELTATEVTSLYNSGTPVDPTADGGDYASSANLVGSWDMENTGTTTVTDNSTNSNDGTLTNGAAFDADVPVIAIPTWDDSRSLDFDGTDDYIDCGASFPNINTDAITIAFWAKITDNSQIHTIVGNRGTTSGWDISINAGLSGFRNITFYNDKAATGIRCNFSTYDTWVHIAVVRAGIGSSRIYVNGVSQALTLDDEALTNPEVPHNLYIGGGLSTGSLSRVVEGNLSEVCLWSSELTSGNVTSLYNSGTPIDSSTIDSANVAGHWPLEAGSGKTAIDYSGNGNHGTLINGPTWSSDTP